MELINKCEDLVIDCYRITNLLPNSENYVLKNQMNRACISIGSNVVEGNSRKSPKEYLNFLSIAMGSLCELEFQNNICYRLYNLKIDNNKIVEVKKMINGLKSYLKSTI